MYPIVFLATILLGSEVTVPEQPSDSAVVCVFNETEFVYANRKLPSPVRESICSGAKDDSECSLLIREQEVSSLYRALLQIIENAAREKQDVEVNSKFVEDWIELFSLPFGNPADMIPQIRETIMVRLRFFEELVADPESEVSIRQRYLKATGSSPGIWDHDKENYGSSEGLEKLRAQIPKTRADILEMFRVNARGQFRQTIFRAGFLKSGEVSDAEVKTFWENSVSQLSRDYVKSEGKSLEDYRDTIRLLATAQKSSEAVRSWAAEQLRHADVEIKHPWFSGLEKLISGR